ncbi:MAG: pyridoxal phosphate-dependent aminotransferase [Campylobacterales bacterium]
MYSDRITSLSPSMTIAVSTLARELKAQGRDIISFSAGEPDFDTPQVIKDAAINAINEGFTKYTSTSGIDPLIEEIIAKLKRDNNLEYEKGEIITNNGAKHSLFNVFQALIQDGDEVIVPAPYWVTYPELIKYSGGRTVSIDTDESSGFKITPSMLATTITKRTKLLVLTTPSNPTGATYSKDEIEALAEVLKGSDIKIISDEIYEKLVYDGEFCSVGSVSSDMLERTITINGLSKSASMTGWRFGYIASKDKKLIKLIDSLQSQSTSNICSITQKAAIAGLNGSADSDIEAMRGEFKKRRDFAVDAFNSIDKLSVLKPDGAFYLFVNIKELGLDSMEFSKKLLEEAGVAVVPGIGFGLEGYFRFSFASSLENIKNGINRIEDFVSKL